jgi:hypothetical protein
MDKKCKLCVNVFTLAILFKEENVDTKAWIRPASGLKKLRSGSRAKYLLPRNRQQASSISVCISESASHASL